MGSWHSGMRLPSSTKTNEIVNFCIFFNTILLTLPHDEVAVLEEIDISPFSAASSSAKPQEQSLQAFRFPVVPHTR